MAAPHKLLLAINCMNIGGAPTVVFEQLKQIDRSKFEPHLLTLYKSKKANYLEQLDVLPAAQQHHFQLRNRSLFDLKTLVAMIRMMRKEQFTAVCTHLFLANTIVRFAAWVARVPVVLSYEHSFYHKKRRWQQRVDRWLARTTVRILTPSQQIADFTAKQESIPASKFLALANPVSIPSKEQVDVPALRKELGIAQDDFVVMTLGRFSVEKDHQRFLDIAATMIERDKNTVFLLFGHGPLEQELRTHLASLNCGDRCKIIVEPARAKDFLFIADAFVCTSTREGQPIAVLEAMMAGVPVVGSPIKAIQDIVTNGENGMIAASNSVEDFATAIAQLRDDSTLRIGLRKGGLRTARQFDATHHVRTFERLVHDLIP